MDEQETAQQSQASQEPQTFQEGHHQQPEDINSRGHSPFGRSAHGSTAPEMSLDTLDKLSPLGSLNISSTLKPPSESSRTSLPTSPSQRSIEKAIAQKFASLGMPQRPTWRAKMDRFVLNEGNHGDEEGGKGRYFGSTGPTY